MELEEARDILANCINDYVIAEYFSSCDDKESCKDDCIFSKAIETVLSHLTKQEKMIDLMGEELVFGVFDFKSKEQAKQYFEKKAEGYSNEFNSIKVETKF